jgi:hypothetical protein
MNAAERLWRALEQRDWNAVRAQLHEHAVIEWPCSGQRLTVDDYVVALATRLGDRPVHVVRAAVTGDLVALEATVGDARCAGFYDLHVARVEAAVEYWVGAAD